MSNINSTPLDNPKRGREQVEPATGESIPESTYRKPKDNTKITYSLSNQAKDEDGRLITFTPRQRQHLNTIDGLRSTGDTLVTIDIYIRRFYAADAYEPTDEERNLFFKELAELAVLTGFSISQEDDNVELSIGSLVPIIVKAKGKINGQTVDTAIHILEYTCIHNTGSKNIEYWRLKFPNGRMRKTAKNVSINRKVLDCWISGESVNVPELSDELGITKDDSKARHDLIQTIVSAINYQREYSAPEPHFEYDDVEGRGRASIKSIDTK